MFTKTSPVTIVECPIPVENCSGRERTLRKRKVMLEGEVKPVLRSELRIAAGAEIAKWIT